MGLVMEDMPMVLFEVSRGLDIIELSLSKDAELRSAVHHWRDYLGRWRNSLSHLSWSTSSMLEELKHNLEEVNAPSSPLVASSRRMKASALKHKVRQVTQLYNDLQTIATRVETTFEALMSTLSILESQRAITQAETISKLTHLAFFFIPLSFVATVFGMEVVEFQDELTWRLWLGISVGITASTYLTLYASEAWLMLSNLPTTIYNSIDWSTFSAIWTSGLTFLEKSFTSVRVFFALVAIVLGLGVLAGLAVVGTLLPFSTGATVGLSFGMAMSAICLIISFGVWLDALRRQIERDNPVVPRNLTSDRGEKGRTDAELQALSLDPELKYSNNFKPRILFINTFYGKMKLTPITLGEVAALTPVTQDEAEHIYIFDQLGTQGCLLDCEAWKTRQDVAGRRTTTQAEKRQKRKDIKKLGKSSILKQRQTLQNDTRIPNSSLKFKREAFTLKDLKHSVENGCGCCQFFLALLNTLLPTRENLDVDHLVFEWIRYGFLLKVQDKQRTFSFQFFSPSGAKSVIHGLKSAKVLTGDTSTSTSLDLAQSWIQDCETTHGQCGSGRDVSLPKRCLDLAPISMPDGSAIQLVETHGKTGTYVCLSHCWGKDKLITTTSQTIASHFNKIPLTGLPKTFRDAVTLTRNLGLRYLWIDSLCIIQGSKEDWQIESSKMADIYHDSFLTIAAISSPDSRGGCFCPEKLSDMCFRVQGGGLDTLIAVRYCNGEGAVSDLQTFMEAFPALTRAWIYQERMLSRRILYCTYREFQFECRQNETCECRSRFMPPHPEPGTPASKAMMQGKDQYGELEKLYGARGKYSPKQLCQHWQKTVMQYTKLRITHLSDKLPALSGCAKDIGRITGDEFLAGLWRASFAEGLLWVVNVPVDQPRAPVWRAPSWSWASIDSTMGIDYIYAMRTRHRQDFQDKIQEVECVPDGVDKTGAVKSAHVQIRASLCPVYLRRVCRRCTTSRSRIPYTIENDQWMLTRSPTITPCPVTPGNDIRGLVLKGAQPSFFPDYKYDDRVDFEFLDRNDGFACRHARVFLIHLYDNQSFATEVITDYFLVLKRVVEASSGSSFERVALITLAFKDWAARDDWFRNEYDLVVEQETTVKIV
ncbi:hypothetical protein CEP54_015893 [Fusarium duplospermum]|uniref:Heterokaryon incompatibility domain-containing protein n=1 Tax=Fusarium duplospermum TaxID=1325734 RepID=A0A428NKA3_9HYPO|nr:hypothetical protein CEP54_015893 [Fusarium duplospermum]